MLALLIKAGADPWGSRGVSHTPIVHYLIKKAVYQYLKNW